jgi:hypothetical protein
LVWGYVETGPGSLMRVWLNHGSFAAQHGDVWVRIPLARKDLRLHVDQNKQSRISFIFTEQVAMVVRAYDMLS